jgi:hypothetical protein
VGGLWRRSPKKRQHRENVEASQVSVFFLARPCHCRSLLSVLHMPGRVGSRDIAVLSAVRPLKQAWRYLLILDGAEDPMPRISIIF